MGLPQVTPPDNLPLWAQNVYIGLFVTVVAVAGAVSYLRGFVKSGKSPTADGKHVVMEAASLADMAKFNQIAVQVDLLESHARAIRELLEEAAENKENDERIQMRIDRILREKAENRSAQGPRKPQG